MLFKNLDLGPDDAKGDVRLSEYFIRTPEYERVRSGEAAFVIGRKGTGKTAICQRIHEEAQSSPTIFSALLSFKNAPTNALFHSADETYNSPNQYISIWKFLIAYEAAKLMLQDESIDNATMAELRTFLDDNFGNNDIGALDAVAMLRDRSWRVSLKIPLKFLDVPGGELAHSSSDAFDQQIHFGRAATELMDRIAAVHSENTFFVIFDELDEDYNIERRYFDLIISLFKATYQIRREVPSMLALRPVVVLREDIFLQLDDHDLNKIDDMLVSLRWHTASATDEFSLRGLINQRFRANLRDRDAQETASDLWPLFVDETAWGGPYTSAWEFCTLRTMLRPRDIIKALKFCQLYEEGERLTPTAIRKSGRKYSEWLSREIGNEMFRVVPDYRQAIGLLTRLGTHSFAISTWRSAFAQNELLARKYEPDVVLERLYEFGVVGMAIAKKRQHWVFKYTHPQILFNSSGPFVLHPGLYDFLALPHEQATSKEELAAQAILKEKHRQEVAQHLQRKQQKEQQLQQKKQKQPQKKKKKKKKKKNKQKRGGESPPPVAPKNGTTESTKQSGPDRSEGKSNPASKTP
ncbi:MAG: hypothetical protein WB952_05555 [Terriglobales bacterium]